MIKNLFFVIAWTLVLTACGPKNNQLQDLAQQSVTTTTPTTTLVVKGYQPQAGQTLSHLFVSNFSTKISQGQILKSSSRDGMSDTLKQSLALTFGFLTSQPESAVFGFADLALYQLGLDVSRQANLNCVQTGNLSGDGFSYLDDRFQGTPEIFLGLRDCDKTYLGLEPKLFNDSGDGIPDYLKMRCGMNPLEGTAKDLSLAGDGFTNIEKCQQNIPVDESANVNSAFAYTYGSQVNSDGSIDFTVANISLVDGGSENFLAVYIVETNLNTGTLSLTSAYLITDSTVAQRSLVIPYWGTPQSVAGGASLLNQALQIPPTPAQ